MNKNRIKGKIIEQYGSQWAFAVAINVQESAVSKVIHGHKPISGDQKKVWAKALDCKPSDLFGE